MHIITGLIAVHVCPKGTFTDALRCKGYVMVNVLAPLHQQLRVVIILPFTGAPDYFPADLPRLLTENCLIWTA